MAYAFRAQFGDFMRDPSAPVYQRWLGRMEARSRRAHSRRRVGARDLLKIAEGRGWSPQGVEISASPRSSPRERGLTVFNGDPRLTSWP
jgi:hypothetical protein